MREERGSTGQQILHYLPAHTEREGGRGREREREKVNIKESRIMHAISHFINLLTKDNILLHVLEAMKYLV